MNNFILLYSHPWPLCCSYPDLLVSSKTLFLFLELSFLRYFHDSSLHFLKSSFKCHFLSEAYLTILLKVASPSSATIIIILFYVFFPIASNLVFCKIYSLIFFFLSVFPITSLVPRKYGFCLSISKLHQFKSLLNKSLMCVFVCVFHLTHHFCFCFFPQRTLPLPKKAQNSS